MPTPRGVQQGKRFRHPLYTCAEHQATEVQRSPSTTPATGSRQNNSPLPAPAHSESSEQKKAGAYAPAHSESSEQKKAGAYAPALSCGGECV